MKYSCGTIAMPCSLANASAPSPTRSWLRSGGAGSTTDPAHDGRGRPVALGRQAGQQQRGDQHAEQPGPAEQRYGGEDRGGAEHRGGDGGARADPVHQLPAGGGDVLGQ